MTSEAPSSRSDPKPRPRRRRRWLWLVPALPLLALAVLNVWLSWLAPTQLSTDRRSLEWSRAWTLWPSTLHVRDLRLVQQGRNQEWQLTAGAARVELDLLGLRERHFHIRRGRGRGVTFFLRRRLAEGAEPGEHLPPIGELPMSQRASQPRSPQRDPTQRDPTQRDPWRITLAQLDLQDVEELWVDDIRLRSPEGTALGRVQGSADFQIRGPMRLDDIVAELRGASLTLGGGEAVQGLDLDATLALGEIPIPELRTLRALDALTASLRLSGEVPSLRFLRELLPAERALKLEGAGRLDAEVKLAGREILEGSTLRVAARQLEVEVGWLDAAGQGSVDAVVSTTADSERRLDLRVDLEGLDVAADRGNPMSARARELDLIVSGVDPRLDRPLQRTELRLELPSVELPDLAEFQPLVPDGLDLRILGGRGVLETRMSLEGGDQNASFRVAAEDAQLRFRGTDVSGSLELTGATVGEAERRTLDLTGVELSFRGATRPTGAGARPAPVSADLALERLRLTFPQGTRVPRIAAQTLRLRGDLEDLGWWSNPFSDSGWLRLAGQADLRASLRIVEGAQGKMSLSSPSEANLTFPELDLALSDWSTSGSARLSGALNGRQTVVDLTVTNPVLDHPSHASFQLPTLKLTARGAGTPAFEVVALAESTRPFALTSLNSYVPTRSFSFGEGLGTMAGRLDWRRGDAEVALSLLSNELTARLLDEPFTGRLKLDVELEAGAGGGETLEISRGQLRLEDVAFPGMPREDGRWWLVADLQGGEVSTGRPLGLDAGVRLRLRDTEPIVRMVGESRRAVRWFHRILEVNDIDGTARLVLEADGAQLRNVDIRGQGLEIVGEIDLKPPGRALLLIDYKALRAGFEMDGDRRDIKVLRPKAWFEERRASWR